MKFMPKHFNFYKLLTLHFGKIFILIGLFFLHNSSYASCTVQGTNIGGLNLYLFTTIPPLTVANIPASTPLITPISDWYTTTATAFSNCIPNERLSLAAAQPSTNLTYDDNGTTYTIFKLPNSNIGYIASVQWTGAYQTLPFPLPVDKGWCFLVGGICYSAANRTVLLTAKIRFIRIAPLSSGVISLPTTATYIMGWTSDGGSYRGLFRVEPTSAIVQTQSCTVNTSNIQVQLPGIQTALLPSAGSTTGATPFNISINCPNAVNAYMTITDNSNPAQTSNIIQAASGSTTTGIGVQIKQNGKIISMGPDSSMAGNPNQFLIGNNVIGNQLIPFSASYIRTSAGSVGAGTLTARATFTMSYQ